jgi:hypothetical protein
MSGYLWRVFYFCQIAAHRTKVAQTAIVLLTAAKSASRWAAVSALVSAPSICALRLAGGSANLAIVIGGVVGENSARREVCD